MAIFGLEKLFRDIPGKFRLCCLRKCITVISVHTETENSYTGKIQKTMLKLNAPIVIRGMKLKNRVLMPAIGTLAMRFGLDGPTQAITDFYFKRAVGGTGSIVFGGLPPSALIPEEDLNQSVPPDLRLTALERFVARMHEGGAKVGVQLFHANLYPSGEVISATLQDYVAPSPRVERHIPPVGQEMRQLTIQEIEAIIQRFARAAFRVRESGADFVEFHLAHGHAQIPYMFFTPLENRRDDRYGGDGPGRMKFGLECVAAIREAVGWDYPLFVRLGAIDEASGGVTPSDAANFAVELEKGGVDCLSVSMGISSTTEHINHIAPLKSKSPMGAYVHMAQTVKKQVDIPVVAVGRLNTPTLAEDILEKSRADIVAICRQLICDPAWVTKAIENRTEEIVPCDSCNTFCLCQGSEKQPATHCCRKTRRPGEEWERFF